MHEWTQPTLAIGRVKPFAVEPMEGAMKSALYARPPAILGLALLCLLLAGPGLSAQLEVYQPRHRPAAELATLAQAMLGADGTAVADPQTGKLVLSGASGAVSDTLQALRKLDIPPTMYRIEVWRTHESEIEGRGLAIQGWLELGDLRIGRLGPIERGARVNFKTRRAGGFKGQFQSLSVLEGHTAEIWTGSTHPVWLRVFQERDTDRQALETTPLAPLRTGFRVWPRKLPNGDVDLALTAGVEEEGSWGTLRQRGVTTNLQLELGEEIVIAEVQRNDSQAYWSPFAFHQQESYSSDTLLWLRVSSAESAPRP